MTHTRRRGRPAKNDARVKRTRLPRFDKPFASDVLVWREAHENDPTGVVRSNVVRTCTQHSPNGYECGYSGSGPADLALNILNAFVPPRPEPTRRWADDLRDDDPLKTSKGVASRFALEHHQAFKRDFIEGMPRSGGRIEAATIHAWIGTRTRSTVTS